MGFQEEVGEWAKETFPGATDKEILIHLKREVEEVDALCKAYGRQTDPEFNDMMKQFANGMIGEEAADCYMLLLHLCHRHGVDLQEEACKKFEINKTRRWGPPDAEGVREHIREEL